jgi:hypothetical protein
MAEEPIIQDSDSPRWLEKLADLQRLKSQPVSRGCSDIAAQGMEYFDSDERGE